ncbi:MAG: transcription termination factor Rho [Lachnospiraceae bacterium]|nr:transcription termination factor Rho [Lachnospiraceae bacterium]
MREKLMTLPVKELREIAKTNGIKSVTTMKKADLVEAILAMNDSKKEASDDKKKKSDGKKETSDDKKKKAEGKNEKDRTESKKSEKEKHGEKSESSNEEGEISEEEYDGHDARTGILEVMPDGFGFIRCDNYMPGDDDVYVAPTQIRRFSLKTGDVLTGRVKARKETDKFAALYYLDRVNGETLDKVMGRKNFEDLTPIFPNERLHLETSNRNMAMRIVDLVSPIGKGQRGMIVSPPKAGKTTLLKETAKSILKNNPEMQMIILLIDERPEEVTDIKEAISGENVEVIYSTFDELPEHHKRVSEMVIERAKRLVEHGKDVIILLDSITRLARAYNLTVPPSGRTLSGGLDPAALHMPKRFFGAARNMREGGSLTILATALVDTGSKMDDVVYEEFKGTGNMELVLDRKLSEKRVFPAIDIVKSGTRREDLLLNNEEKNASYIMRKEINGLKADEAVERILDLFYKTKDNEDFCQKVSRIRKPPQMR